MKIKAAVLSFFVLVFLSSIALSGQNESCEGAFAYGQEELNDFLNTERWGWQITIGEGEEVETPLYAGAAKNDISKGSQVGKLHVVYLNDTVTVSFVTFDDLVMSNTALYVGEDSTSTAAPGQYGNSHEDLASGSTDRYEIDVSSYSGDTVYVVAYAEICSGSDSESRTEEQCEETEFSWKGVWRSNTVYRSGNMVQYDGSSYINICCQSVLGVSPADGFDSSACWDLMVRKGDKGDRGEQGTAGLQGPRGKQGDKGDRGEQGTAGLQGPQGKQGDKGDRGEQGAAGLQGPRGKKGDTGLQGPRGLRGVRGLPGPIGPRGPMGKKGDKGNTGDVGPKGPRGPMGNKGDKGDTGDVGPKGSKGPMGNKGDKGDSGDQGDSENIPQRPNKDIKDTGTATSNPSRKKGQICPDGEFMKGISPLGKIICEPYQCGL